MPKLRGANLSCQDDGICTAQFPLAMMPEFASRKIAGHRSISSYVPV
jgi:hypothetical protein